MTSATGSGVTWVTDAVRAAGITVVACAGRAGVGTGTGTRRMDSFARIAISSDSNCAASAGRSEELRAVARSMISSSAAGTPMASVDGAGTSWWTCW